ncbi:MAG: hypothetical protein KAZ17_01175 [Sphingorhabdus sp.]|nr:hypothetical protein [Sphingorhabdus sp.]
MKIRSGIIFTSALLLASQSAVTPGLAQTKAGGPSRHVQCDGQPNNTTAGETAARLIGAITLLGLFAPAKEAPNPSARLFGDKGVEVCNSLLEGTENVENNPVRRLELLLGRALHYIEAKKYDSAIADAKLAESEATKLGFMADPYFARSFARSFARIEAEALLRQNKPQEAQSRLTAATSYSQFSFYPVLTTATFGEFLRTGTPEEDKLLDAQVRLWPILLSSKAARLEMQGRFPEAAATRESYLSYNNLLNSKKKNSLPIASTALSHALSSDWTQADARAAEAKVNLATRTAEGDPETNRSETVEILDLFNILKLVKNGELLQARRSFAARSQWVGASFGAVLAVNDLLRKNAPADELTGGLAKSSDQLWQEDRDAKLAQRLAKDEDNKSIFSYIYAMDRASGYEALSNVVWNTKKSKIFSKQKLNATDATRFDGYLASIYGYGYGFEEKYDALLLHSALIAKRDGYKNFIFSPNLAGGSALVHFVEPANTEKYAAFSLSADTIVAELAAAIPNPIDLKAIKAARQKKAK